MKEKLKPLSQAFVKNAIGLDGIIVALTRTQPEPPVPPPPPSTPKTICHYQDGSTHEFDVTGTLEPGEYLSAATLVAIEIDGVTAVSGVFNGAAEDYCDAPLLSSVTFGSSVRTINDAAFQDCGSLSSITIPGTITSIGDSTFNYCSNLTSVTIENGVIEIGADAFAGTGLTSITLPSTIVNLPDAWSGYGIGVSDIVLAERTIEDACDWLGITLNEEADEPNYETLHCTNGTLSYDGEMGYYVVE